MKIPQYGWIEEYKGCSCCTVELKKRDLLGYCKFHGGDHKNRMKIPYEKGDPLGNSSDPNIYKEYADKTNNLPL